MNRRWVVLTASDEIADVYGPYGADWIASMVLESLIRAGVDPQEVTIRECLNI